MEFVYEGTIERLDRAAARKAEKEGLVWSKQEDKRSLGFDMAKSESRPFYPVDFTGEVEENDGSVKLEGKTSAGYLLVVLLAMAYVLVIVRGYFWLMQENKYFFYALAALALCVIVTVVLFVKIKKSRKRINQFLTELTI